MGGLEFSKGVQHNYRLAKNTKKKELGTAHHNDASSNGYNRNATPINGNVFVNTCKHTYKFTYHEKRIQTSK